VTKLREFAAGRGVDTTSFDDADWLFYERSVVLEAADAAAREGRTVVAFAEVQWINSVLSNSEKLVRATVWADF
jgi:hypothetical protein